MPAATSFSPSLKKEAVNKVTSAFLPSLHYHFCQSQRSEVVGFYASITFSADVSIFIIYIFTSVSVTSFIVIIRTSLVEAGGRATTESFNSLH